MIIFKGTASQLATCCTCVKSLSTFTRKWWETRTTAIQVTTPIKNRPGHQARKNERNLERWLRLGSSSFVTNRSVLIEDSLLFKIYVNLSAFHVCLSVCLSDSNRQKDRCTGWWTGWQTDRQRVNLIKKIVTQCVGQSIISSVLLCALASLFLSHLPYVKICNIYVAHGKSLFPLINFTPLERREDNSLAVQVYSEWYFDLVLTEPSRYWTRIWT